MKPQEKIAVDNLRLAGISPGEIASQLHLSPNTVRSHLRRHPQIDGTVLCMQCGNPTPQATRRKTKKFCSDDCRMKWWAAHQDAINKKAYYELVCCHCGEVFKSYGNKHRKYCSRKCYLDDVRTI